MPWEPDAVFRSPRFPSDCSFCSACLTFIRKWKQESGSGLRSDIPFVPSALLNLCPPQVSTQAPLSLRMCENKHGQLTKTERAGKGQMTCHNSNGWAEGMISVNINWEHVCSPSLHFHEHTSMCASLMAIYFSSPTFSDRSIFTFCCFWGFFFCWVLKQRWAAPAYEPRLFLYPESNRNMEQWHFHRPLSQAWLSCSLKEGLPSPVWINKFVRQKEQIKANEVVQRDRNQHQRDLVWGLESFSLLSFLILVGLFFFFMKYARVGEDVRREHRDPADHSDGRSERGLFVLNWVTPPAHCSLPPFVLI